MPSCTDDSWADLWIAFDTHRTDEIRVPRPAIADVLRCHGSTPDNLIVTPPRDGSTTVLVNRAALFTLLKTHGNYCNAN